MPLAIHVDREDAEPLYRQIAEAFKERIGDGSLPTGTRLPTIRELARTLEVTRLTVQNAYADLQAGGWIASKVGRGSFVTGKPRAQALVAAVDKRVTAESILREEHTIRQIAGMRLMGSADPDSALFPAAAFWSCLNESRADRSLLGYGSPQGDAELRAALLPYLRARGIRAEPEEIIISSGVTQGLSLITQALARPGDVIAVEQPAYMGFLNLLRAQGLQPVGVPLDEGGPRLDALERIVIQQRPRFFYTVPGFQNPTGLSMSPARRRDLLALAGQYGLLLVEDDIYGRLAYDAPAPPALKAADDQDLVVYLDSVSKVLMPGLRLVWVLAPPPLHDRLISLRQAQDLCGNPLMQRTLAHFLAQGKLKTHLQQVLPLYRERRDALLQALRHTMPAGVSWTRPKGGFCLWLTLPDRDTFDDLYRSALRRGLTFTPGDVFLAQPEAQQHLRLCFGNQPAEGIKRSVALLAALVEERTLADAHLRDLADWPPLV